MNAHNRTHMPATSWPGPKDYISGERSGHSVMFPTNTALDVGAGPGISSGTGTICENGVRRDGNIITTTILIDVTGLNSSVAGDTIGVNAATGVYLAQIDFSRCGTPFAGGIRCLETPAGGEPDIDLYSYTEGNMAEDDDEVSVLGTALVNTAVDWTSALAEKHFTGLPADGEYLYLLGSGGGTAATYTAGKFVITLYGYADGDT